MSYRNFIQPRLSCLPFDVYPISFPNGISPKGSFTYGIMCFNPGARPMSELRRGYINIAKFDDSDSDGAVGCPRQSGNPS